MKIDFVKYSGNGNDFIILDHPHFEIKSEFIQRLCDRHFGVGADGVLILLPSEKAHGRMQIYNADGGEAEMCGNGLRCLATYLDQKAAVKQAQYLIETMHGLYPVKKAGQQLAIEMTEIKDQQRYDLSSFSAFDKSYFVNTGVPHLVFLVAHAKQIDIKAIAPFYRHHPIFPQGTNVSFVEISGEQQAYVRTFERGVEDETFSCGTGLTAAALALKEWFNWQGEIKLTTKGGLHLIELGEKIYFSGEVVFCFKGEWEV